MQTFLFYDIETTGLNKAFDQVLHFAAIRTDTNLNEVGRYELKVKLNPDVVPSPYAFITHHMALNELAQGVSEYDAIVKIHAWLNEPGTISVGYNTLGFDDEFLRFSFYRNLLPPYTHQYANDCGRMDLYPVTILYHLFKKDILKWPEIDGETRLKLELLNSHNQFAQGASHNAMVDVEVTLALAKRFFAEKEMWRYAVNSFTKTADLARSKKFPYRIKKNNTLHHEGLILDGKFKSSNHFMAPAIYLGEHSVYNNQSLWLRLDNIEMQHVTKENFKETTWRFIKKWGEPSFLLPLEERFLARLQPERAQLFHNNITYLQEHPDLFDTIIQHYQQYLYPDYPNVDANASLYLHGFWNFEETAFCKRFHLTAHNEKHKLLNQITNPKLKNLCMRLMGRNFFDYLPHEYQLQFHSYLKDINPNNENDALIDFKNAKRLTPRQAKLEIAELLTKPELSLHQRELLHDLESYLKTKFPLPEPTVTA